MRSECGAKPKKLLALAGIARYYSIYSLSGRGGVWISIPRANQEVPTYMYPANRSAPSFH